MIIKEDYLRKYNMETLEEVKEMFGDTKETEINYYKTFLKKCQYVYSILMICIYFILLLLRNFQCVIFLIILP